MNKVEEIQSERRADLDWLRVLAVLLLVPFHSSLIFNSNPEVIMYVKDTSFSQLLDRLAGWLHQFHMPVLFIISGASSYFALKKRNSLKYIQERFSRILIPAIFGIIFLVPPMTFLTLKSQGITIGFWQHFTNFWQISSANLTGIDGKFTPAHLWFLVFLFLFSLIAIPLFLILKTNNSKSITKRIADVLASRWNIFLLFIPLALAASIHLLGDKNPIYYFLLFFIGYLLMTDNRYQKVIDKYAFTALLLGILCEFSRQFLFQYIQGGTSSYLITGLVGQLNRWLWVIAVLGFGHRFLNHSNKLLRYLSSASYPFYLFHLLINTLVGYYLIKTQMSITLKYIIIVVLTMISTFLVYELIKRIPFIRFLFGIKKYKKPVVNYETRNSQTFVSDKQI